ncbi:unnamed protein product [Colias eurytheme]|nr:unnamed protein product [Colias eurytheme]
MALSPTPGTSGTSNIKLTTPKSKPPKKRLDIDDFMVCSIRNIIEQYYTTEKEVPTLRKVLAQAKKDFNFPVEKTTLWKIITTKLGYSFKKCKKNLKKLCGELATYAKCEKMMKKVLTNSLLFT